VSDDVLTATAPLGGFAHDKFAAARDLFERRLADGTEVGASLAVSIEGELVVDLWGGWADAARTRAWAEDTLVNVYSVSKTMTAITALFLADRGVINFDAPVASYWPEFAEGGKGDIEVSHLMAHSAGLSGWREPMAPADLYDWEKATTLLGRQTPYWPPGTASGYHGITQGYLVGEVVRRATGEMLGEIFRREIAGPLGADFHLGLAAADHHRVAPMVAERAGDGPPRGAAPGALMINAVTNPMLYPFMTDATGTPEWTTAHIYAANGQGNGRSIAKVHALMANGGELGGKRLMSEAGCRRALDLQIEGVDLVLGMPARFGMGFGLPGAWLETPHPDCIFWPGSGGAMSLIDMKSRMSFGYAMNQRGGSGSLIDPRAHALLKATWNALAS
jgi:CubicO group peptidase (beta-lactamase class C family)